MAGSQCLGQSHSDATCLQIVRCCIRPSWTSSWGGWMPHRVSGGAHTSRTMLLTDLTSVLSACPPLSTLDAYRAAVIDDNVAGKNSQSSRQRTFRYLREMYLLDINAPSFRALLRLWARDPVGRPLIAMVMAVSNDPALAATQSGILTLAPGEVAKSSALADAVEREFPGSYSASIRAKIGRNALSSWTQSGYLRREGRKPAVRKHVDPTPGAVAMALVLGESSGVSGERLFDTPQAALLDISKSTLHDRTHEAARKGWLGYRSRGMVTEIDLDALTAGIDDPRLSLAKGVPA